MPVIENWRELEAVASRAEPATRRALRASIKRLKATIALSRLRTGQIPLTAIVEQFAALQAVFQAVAAEAVRASMRTIALKASFTLVNDDAVVAALSRRVSARLVRGVAEEIKDAIRVAVSKGIGTGVPMAQTAREIRDTVGLGRWQVQSLARQRAELIRRGYTGTRLEKAMAARAKRALIVRSETIIRTETIRAANLGQQALWERAERVRNDGRGNAAVWQRRWIVTPDSRLCPVCRPMNRQQVGMNEDFVSPYNGRRARMPPMHPRCRCAMGLALPSSDTRRRR